MENSIKGWDAKIQRLPTIRVVVQADPNDISKPNTITLPNATFHWTLAVHRIR